MSRRYAFVLTVFGAVFAAPVLNGCRMQASAGGAEEPPPPPPAPEPAPAAPAPTPAATAEPTPEKPKSVAVLKGDSIQIPGNIVFDTGKATLKEGAGSETVLEQLKLFLDENPQVTKLRVEGHTDNVGKPPDNEKLSGERALTIKRWLVDKGIAKERVLAVGFGQNKPIADNGNEAGRAQNRRTEFRLAEINGKRYLGMDPTGGGKVHDF